MLYFVTLVLIAAANCAFTAPNNQVIIELSGGDANEIEFSPIEVDENAEIHPFLVSLSVYFGGPYYYLCTGSIIDSYWIVTAAHCFFEGADVAQAVIIRAGSIYIHKGGQVQYGLRVHVPEYQSMFSNNIALLKTRLAFPTNNPETINPIALPPQGTRPPDGKCGKLACSLFSADVCTISLASCRASYGSIITDTMLCADVDSSVDNCQGIAGCPITIDNILVGIGLLRAGCTPDIYPAISTDVSSFRTWIDSIVK